MAEKTAGDVARMLDHMNDELMRDFLPAELQEIGEFAVTTILLRTKKGLDVDRQLFRPYSERYAAERAAAGLQTSPPDLTRTGHMLGSIEVVPGAGEVKIAIMSEAEVPKAAAHNFGVDKTVPVKAHQCSGYMHSKKGRISKAGAAKTRSGAIEKRTYMTTGHTRHMKMPQREFVDIRAPEEIAALEDVCASFIVSRVEKTLKTLK